MKDIIKKILSEQVHPDYDFIDEGDQYLDFKISDIRLILMTLKRHKLDQVSKYNWVDFLSVLESTFAITNRSVLTKLLLVAYFNRTKDLIEAYNNKSTDGLYLGPFYRADIAYWDSDSMHDVTYEEMDCDQCSGYGEHVEDCDECGGSGEIECYECDEENEECQACDGSGEVPEECSQCYGSGAAELEEDVWTIENMSRTIVSKIPVEDGDYDYFTDLYNRGDDILFGRIEYNETYETNWDSDIDFEDEIEMIESKDIIIKGEDVVTDLLG